MNPDRRTVLLRTLAGSALFLALSAAVVLVFLRLFAPEPPPPRTPPFDAYDKAPMDAAVSVEAVGRELEALLGFGSRYVGQPGFYATYEHIRAAFRGAGLEVTEYPLRIPMPVTARREIRGADGELLPDVQVYPFMPNHFQPIVTPEDGLSGTLVLVSQDVLLSRPTFTNCIALVDAARPPETFMFSWVKYAQLGFRAVVVADRHGLTNVNWATVGAPGTMTVSVPVNFCRLAATESIFDYVDQPVNLRVRVDWRNLDAPTVVGVMRADPAAPRSEAVLVTSCYDAGSVLPDLAPGSLAATRVAFQLAFLKGLPAYRAQLKRDVVFVSYPSQTAAQFPADRLSALMGTALAPDEGRARLELDRAENDAEAAGVEAALQAIGAPGFFADPKATAAELARLSPAGRAAIEEQVRHVLNTLVLELSEEPLRTRVAFLARAASDLSSPEFKAYRAAKTRYDATVAAAGFAVTKLVAEAQPLVQSNGIPARCEARLRELAEFHRWRAAQIRGGLAIHAALAPYRQRLIPVGAYLVPADPAAVSGEALSFHMGGATESQKYHHSHAVNEALLSLYQRLALPAAFRYEPLRNSGHHNWAAGVMDGLPTDAAQWNGKGHPGFVLLNTDRVDAFKQFNAPVEPPYARQLGTLANSLRFSGQFLLSLGFGEGRFEEPQKTPLTSLGGRVFVTNVGRSIVPNYPLQNALVGHKASTSAHWDGVGCFRTFFVFTDPYGRYHVPLCSAPFTVWGVPGFSPEAAGFDPEGRLAFIKDEGPAGQAVYKSMNLGWAADREHVNLVVFRASPVTVLDLINPQNLNAFSGLGFVSSEGLAPLTRLNTFGGINGIVTTFLEPDRRFFVTFKAGAADNPLVQTIRAFALNVDAAHARRPDREIDGPGYLPLDTPFLLEVPGQIARSMLAVNGARLDLQDRYDMADERTQAFHEQAATLLADSATNAPSQHAGLLLQRDAATYAILNHPVLRRSIFEAVVGILWYLGLLVPFVFFFEKLVFGFADIRKQLAAQATIFLVAFLILRLLHPAFQMIRSSLMILLGFVVMLVSGGITVLFSGKFQENIEELRKKRGQVSAAEINTLGVLGTAFALGLNNMHRRIVRTGLTCATLVLITFAMICFTSVQSNLVNVSTAVGRAAYQGFLVKPEKMNPISESELFALQSRYGHLYTVAPRRLLVGQRDWNQICYNPEIDLAYEPSNGIPRKLPVASVMTFAPDDPLRDRLRLPTRRGWFVEPEPGATPADAPIPVLLPAPMAQELGLSPERVDTEEIVVTLNGRKCAVYGIFEPESLTGLRDLDDRSLLPFDAEALRTIQTIGHGYTLIADDEEPRLNAERIVLAPDGTTITAGHGEWRLVSVGVHMPALAYKTARAEIERYLEQSGRDTYFGLDDIAYRGKRARESSFAGMLEILIPLIIAAMTVLNTMRGSVYERRDEIFVYNAVGIAPRYIFAMFFSEAFVYAVVGTVLGYMLSQGTGRALAAFGWTGGLNMTFSSLTTIYASLAIMAAVFISTLFPARSAMEIAAPSEDQGWDLPEPEGDTMSFALPFTFDHRDRIAVLAFFNRYLHDHGEGSSGQFFAGVPEAGLAAELDPLDGDGYVPRLRCPVWLKPFDLGVAQELTISLPTDAATREYIARITLTRVSGSRESWIRLNYGFVTLLRQNFLYWRAVSLTERARLFDEARGLLERKLETA
jgi:hypothetical protein